MGGACGTYWRGKKGIHDLGGKKNERNRVPEDLGVDGKYVFYINRMGGSGMD